MSANQSFLAPLDNLGLIQVTGDDQITYLQGQVTCDLGANTSDNALLGCHCDAKGKMWSNFVACQLGDRRLLVTDKSALPASLAELKKYGVFSQVDIADTTADWRLYGGTGADVEQAITTVFGSVPQQHLGQVSSDLGLVVAIAGEALRYLVIVNGDAEGKLIGSYGQALSPGSVWEMHQILAGWPSLTIENQQAFTPQMMNMQALGAISFTKGCYMGQEVVARTKYLGKNKRSGFILSGDTAGSANPGDDLEIDMGDDRWRRAGTVISVAGDGRKQCLIAVLPIDTPADARLRLKQKPAQTFSVVPLPYALDG